MARDALKRFPEQDVMIDCGSIGLAGRSRTGFVFFASPAASSYQCGEVLTALGSETLAGQIPASPPPPQIKSRTCSEAYYGDCRG